LQKNLQSAVEAELISFLVESVKKAIYDGDLDLEKVPAVSIEVPREKGHGDYATNLAMVLAGQAGMNPRQIAEIIVENFESEIVEDVNIAGPGFINFKLKNAWLWNNLKIITERGADYGKIDAGNGRRVQVEFVLQGKHFIFGLYDGFFCLSHPVCHLPAMPLDALNITDM